MTSPIIVWFRRNFRLHDNPPLHYAALQNAPIIPVYCHSPRSLGRAAPGGASKVWLHHSLTQFNRQLTALGTPLIIRETDNPINELEQLADQLNASAIYYDKRYEPTRLAKEQELEQRLGSRLSLKGWNANLLVEPGSLYTKQNEPYKVFSPFWKNALRELQPTLPLPAPSRLTPTWESRGIRSLTVEALNLLPATPWHRPIVDAWDIGEEAALRRWQIFLGSAIEPYKEDRNRPDVQGTSSLSPHLHFGEISPRQLWHDIVQSVGGEGKPLPKGHQHYLSELGWREFAHNLLFHFPQTVEQPLRAEFANFPWDTNPQLLKCWQRGQTGYPIVDAAMRQLWSTGWMHNRLRMIVGSFLVKNLLMDWKQGERWFWDTLVDADLANNVMGWQWIAGCGADAAPYFRIFNPILQAEKFDPEGVFVRQWLPELQDVPKDYIHKPWEMKPLIQRDCGVVIGKDYPHPLVDHFEARNRALQAYERVKQR